GGPPMALLLQHQDANKLRGNLSAFFVFSSILSLIVLMGMGLFTMKHFWLTVPLIPAAMLGYWVAIRSVNYLSKEWMRHISLFLCLVSGSSAIWQGLS
ncbi:sulfite exporter TauE/SafE family protein, partial [Vibrio breoganii]